VVVVRAAIAVAMALVLAPPALGGGVYAEVLSPDGQVVAVGQGPSFDYPADGSLVHVGHADVSPDGVTLTDVAATGAILQATQLYLPAGRGAPMSGTLAAAGRVVQPAPNTLVPLGLGYVIIDQRAKSRGRLGRVGIRIVLERAAFGEPAGTQVLLGVPARPARATVAAASDLRGRLDPLAALGFAAGDAALLGYVAPPSATSSSLGERAVALAERFLGVPYAWGGAAPLTGFDCSGLVMFVYGQLGISLTHYTGAQFTEGLRLPREELQPGDLVFFENDPVRGPQHEGIYIGGDRFVQAPHTGDVVKISSLADPTYGFSFVGAVRPYVLP
jgi:cell wall-associated NlpC family hydrolase